MTQTVAIIGGGVSGTAIVLNCLKQATAPLQITWFDSQDLFCRGLAYSTEEDVHLLNVRASNMSIFPDDAAHFAKWLKAHHYPFDAKDFVPRKVYGAYVVDTFHALKEKNPFVSIIQKPEEVTAVTKDGAKFMITAKENHEVNKVVLAIGNFLPGHPRSGSGAFTSSANYFQNAFAKGIIENIVSKKSITIIGAGLTMIDLVLALKNKQYQGKIHIISPHGYLPQAHTEQAQPVESFVNAHHSYSLLEVFALVKQQLRKANKEKGNLYGVIDALRPHIQQLWLGFSTDDQRRFLRHLRHKWGVARHRAPASSMELVNELIASGQLIVLKGRIYQVEEGEAGFTLFYKDDKGKQHVLKSEAIVNCTGPEPDFNKVDSNLIKHLIHSGLMENHVLSYGLKASKTGELSPNLFTIGPPLKGVLWESTAVPEIRVQAADIAGKIIFD